MQPLVSPATEPAKETQAAVSPSRMVPFRSAGGAGGAGNSKKTDEWVERHFGWRSLGGGGYMRPRLIHH